MRKVIYIFYTLLLSALFAWACTPDVEPTPNDPEEGGNAKEEFDPNIDLPIEPYNPYYPSSEWSEEEFFRYVDLYNATEK